jgi:Zn-dependent protease
MTFIIVLIGWVFSLTLHEFSHAIVAYQGGDYTVKDKGYLTFNPLKYTHLMYSIILPLMFLMMGGIGLPGGAVYIERWRLRGPRWETAVSLAGPASNALLALVLGLILRFTPVVHSSFGPGLAFLALLQVSAVVLNLIPVPPFDGFGALEPYLPMEWRAKISEVRGMLSIAVFVLLWSVPFVYNAFWSLIFFLSQAVGVPLQTAIWGLNQFRFWQ